MHHDSWAAMQILIELSYHVKLASIECLHNLIYELIDPINHGVLNMGQNPIIMNLLIDGISPVNLLSIIQNAFIGIRNSFMKLKSDYGAL